MTRLSLTIRKEIFERLCLRVFGASRLASVLHQRVSRERDRRDIYDSMTLRMILAAARTAFKTCRNALASRWPLLRQKTSPPAVVSREAMYIENFALLELTLDHLNQGW